MGRSNEDKKDVKGKGILTTAQEAIDRAEAAKKASERTQNEDK